MDGRLKVMVDAIESFHEILPEDKKQVLDKMLEEMFASLEVDTIVQDPDYPEYKISPPFNAAVVKWTRENWAPRSDDVIIASFPKTGTTWSREIVRQILYKDAPEEYKISKHCELPFFGYFEGGSALKYEIIDESKLKRRVWGTHLPTELLNMDSILKSGCKIIYIMRNPKDTAISLKNFMESLPFMKHPEIKKFFPSDIDDFVKSFVQGKLPIYMKDGEWYPQHIRSWMKYKDYPNIHYVFYEEMKQNPTGEIKKISQHINAPLTDAELLKIVDKTSFNSMKKAANEALQGVKMFRKGAIGNWKEHLSEESSDLIETTMKKGLGDLKVDFKYSADF